MSNDGLNTMTYNGESRVASSAQAGTTTTYTYDGNGLRVAKQVGAVTPTVYIFSGTKVIAEYTSGAAPGSPTKEYIYSGSALLATITGTTTNYHISDHLSARVTTDLTGAIIGQQGHYPFGEDWYSTNTITKFRLTSYERDGESGNDYAMMRISINRLGRFSSPDPLAGSIADPQSLNRYAYVLNDPSNLADPSRLRVRPLEDSGDGWLLGGYGPGEGGSCFVDGQLTPCWAANALLRSGAAVQVPPGVALSGWMLDINGDPHFYHLSALGDEEGAYLSFNYFGLSAAQIEALGLPSTIDVLGIGGGQGPGSGGGGKSFADRLKDILKRYPLCAGLLGGSEKAIRLIDNLSVNSTASGVPLLADSGQRATAMAVASFQAPAAVWFGTRTLGIWNQGPFTVYANSTFYGYSGSEQMTVLIHELRHVALGRTPASHGIDVPNSGADSRAIQKLCGTALPPPFNR